MQKSMTDRFIDLKDGAIEQAKATIRMMNEIGDDDVELRRELTGLACHLVELVADAAHAAARWTAPMKEEANVG